MIKSEKKIKELAIILDKDNNILISEAIKLLRDEQPFEGAIGLLTAFYDKTEDLLIKKNIEGFLNDLKDQSVSKEIIIEILKPFKPATISMLVSSCWQSGLNYSEYATDLVEIFLKGDYVTALECLTVIEESVPLLSRTKKDKIMRLIEKNPLPVLEEKTALTLELISVLGR
jgi:hypothetical protein